MKTEDKRYRQFVYGGLKNETGLKKNKKCLECKREIQKARDAFHFSGMQPYTYYCRPCYFKMLD